MSAQRADKPLLLDLLGFDDRSRCALEMAIGSRSKGRCVLAHASVATAVLVDIDRVGTQQNWDKYSVSYPGRVAIFTSLDQGKQPAGAHFLQKPIVIEQFIALLDHIEDRPSHTTTNSEGATPGARIDSTESTRRSTTARTVSTLRQTQKSTRAVKLAPAAGMPSRQSQKDFFLASAEPDVGEKLIETLPDIDCMLPEQVAERTYSGRASLLSMLSDACAKVRTTKKAYRLKIGASDWITIASDGRLVWTNLDEQRFDSLFIETWDVPLDLAVCLPEEEKMTQGTAKWCTDAEAILWRAGSATYRGKLPPGTDPKARVFLSRWPNLTRVLELPNAVRIAAIWTEQRLSLAFTAEILKIPQSHVFAFYGAAHSAGLAGPAQRSEDVVIAEAPVEPNSRRGLFAKILDRLRRRGA
jgi:hypothetical protein